MIHYVVPEKFRRHSIDPFLATWGRTLQGRLCPIAYHDLFRKRSLQPGVIIFTHFEGLSAPELKLAEQLCDRLAGSRGALIPLNNPGATLDRYELGVRLFEAGINNFRPRHLHEDFSSLRFPVFVRLAKEHGLWMSELLHNHDELKSVLEALRSVVPELHPRDAMVLEFCDVSRQGVFRKYSALRIADEIIPRHLLFGFRWVTKYPDLMDAGKADEELEFVRNFEHADRLRSVFDLAGVDYGRIDYAFQDGQLRVWEINTNPVIVPPPEELHPRRMTAQTESANRILQAFERLDRRIPAGPEVMLWRWFERRLRRNARRAGKRHVRERQRLIARLREAPAVENGAAAPAPGRVEAS